MKILRILVLALLAAQSAGRAQGIAEAITPEIQALARGLENDPKRIFDYVHDHIRYQAYFGSKKGAQLTLLERSGSDFDQCALLVALLGSAGYTNLTYQFAPVYLPYESADHVDFKHWVGATKPNTNWTETYYFAAWMLSANGGFPFVDAFVGDYNDLIFQHVWVQLNLGGTNYLLDPSFKVSEPIAGIDVGPAMGLNTNDLVSAAGGTSTSNYVQNLNQAALRDKLRGYTTGLLGYPSADSKSSPQPVRPWGRVGLSTCTITGVTCTR